MTQHNHHSVHILFFTCCMFFQIQLDQIVPMLVKNVSNTCSAKTYYINHLKVKAKFTLEQAMKAQRWSRGTALLFP
jgi:hypothetical protein